MVNISFINIISLVLMFSFKPILASVEDNPLLQMNLPEVPYVTPSETELNGNIDVDLLKDSVENLIRESGYQLILAIVQKTLSKNDPTGVISKLRLDYILEASTTMKLAAVEKARAGENLVFRYEYGEPPTMELPFKQWTDLLARAKNEEGIKRVLRRKVFHALLMASGNGTFEKQKKLSGLLARVDLSKKSQRAFAIVSPPLLKIAVTGAKEVITEFAYRHFCNGFGLNPIKKEEFEGVRVALKSRIQTGLKHAETKDKAYLSNLGNAYFLTLDRIHYEKNRSLYIPTGNSLTSGDGSDVYNMVDVLYKINLDGDMMDLAPGVSNYEFARVDLLKTSRGHKVQSRGPFSGNPLCYGETTLKKPNFKK